MTNVTMKLEQSQPQTDAAVHLFDNWFDPIEAGLRDRVREFIHAMVEGELDMALSRPRYARCAKASSGESGGRGRCQWPPPRPSVAVAAWKLRPDGDRGAAREAEPPDGKPFARCSVWGCGPTAWTKARGAISTCMRSSPMRMLIWASR